MVSRIDDQGEEAFNETSVECWFDASEFNDAKLKVCLLKKFDTSSLNVEN